MTLTFRLSLFAGSPQPRPSPVHPRAAPHRAALPCGEAACAWTAGPGWLAQSPLSCVQSSVRGFSAARPILTPLDAPLEPSAASPSEADSAPTPRTTDKYQRILDAAVDVIAENGFFNSPVSSIAARAGVADGTVYLYFKSKDHILRSVIDNTFRDFFAMLREQFAATDDARAQLSAIAVAHLQGLASHRGLAILLQTEVRQSARFVAEFSHQHLVDYLNLIREVIRRGQQQGVFRAELSDRIVAHCLFGALDEIVSAWVFTGRPFDPVTTANQILDVLLAGIRTDVLHA